MSDKKGGYRLVSLKLIELSTMTACAGLYQAIESSHDKPLCLCDILVSGAKKNNVYITAIKGTNKYTLKHIYGYILEVTNEDVVTISQDSEGIELPVPEASDDGKIVGVNAQGKYVLKPSVKEQVEDGAESGTIVDALGLDEDGKLVKGAVSGGGTKLYKHILNDGTTSLELINTSNEEITAQAPTLLTILESGIICKFNHFPIYRLNYMGGTIAKVDVIIESSGTISLSTKDFETSNYSDTVTEL